MISVCKSICGKHGDVGFFSVRFFQFCVMQTTVYLETVIQLVSVTGVLKR